MTTRFALLVATSDPLLSSLPARLEALAWLRNQLSRRGFQIAIVGGAGDPLAELERIATGISTDDSVLVHVSGRLVTTDSIALRPTTSLVLPDVTRLLADRKPGYVSIILDLVDGEESEPSTDRLSEVARSLGTTEHGYSALVALRPLSDASERIAFTRLAMPPFDRGGPPSGEAFLAAMHDRAAASGADSGDRRFVLLRGASDPTIDGQISRAVQANDWQRVVELRLDRAEALATVAQRAHELVGAARTLQDELGDPDAAVDVLERARTLDPKHPAVLEALRTAYEASSRAIPIDPAEYAKAFAAHRRAGQADAALLDAMLLDELGVAEPEHRSTVEQARTAGPVQVLKPLDDAAWGVLRAPGFDDALASLLAGIRAAAIAVRLEQTPPSRRGSPSGSAVRLDAESTVSAVRTLHWAARVLSVTCPDLYVRGEDEGEAVTHVAGEPPSIRLAPSVLSGNSTKQLAFLAGRTLSWYRPEYQPMLYCPTMEDLRRLVGAALEIGGVDAASKGLTTSSLGGTRLALAHHVGTEDRAALGEAAGQLAERRGELRLEQWVRSAELTAARAGLLLCGELKIAVAGGRSQSFAPGPPAGERVTSDLVTFCASRAHAELRAQFLRL